MKAENWRVTLVHDYLTQFGGAERVLVSLHDLFPRAPVFTSLADYEELPADLQAWEIHECFPKDLPGITKYHRFLLPLYPGAFRRLAVTSEAADVVIADSSAWAHHVGVGEETALVCYCHSPARFLYGDQDYLSPARMPIGARTVAPLLFAGLRRTDRRAAARVDRYVANSQTVARRIRRAYGRQVTVIYPPVDVARFHSERDVPAEPWFLIVSRIVPHKRVDLAVETCTKHGIPLKVIGTGRALEKLQERAGPTVEFLGYCPDEVVSDHLRRCRAFILPGAEDFGITAVEAQAAGRPVIAFGAGGALESVIPWETGVFFGQQTVDNLYEAIEAFEKRSWDPARARANAARFDTHRFQQEILMEVEAAIAAKRATLAGGRRVNATGSAGDTSRPIEVDQVASILGSEGASAS
jgi:glycosyltransferase involved in cell wall biosynthesis